MKYVRTQSIARAGCGRGLALVALMSSILLHAQTPKLEPDQPQHPSVPTVSFTFDWPSIQPHRYVITVDSSGNAAYQSWMAEPTAEQSIAGEPYMVKFTVSAPARDRIFALARQLNYFNGDFEYHKHRVAATGDKTLAYADPDKQHQTTYNWSENPGIEELTALFQGISATIESGRRLERLRRYDPLGLDEELKNLERLALDHRAVELQIISPLLQQLADDRAVMNIARQRARHILQMAGTVTAGSAQAPPK
jgi:hypothetical protein